MRTLYLLALAAVAAVSAPAQTPATHQIIAAGNLIQHGHYTDAIDSLTPLAQDNSLAPKERGRAQMLLGLANRNLWRMAEAETLYGQALGTFMREGKTTEDFANALDCMAALELARGDWKSAERKLQKAVQIDKALGAHASLAEAYLHLAVASLRRKKLKDAAGFLDAAHIEIPLAGQHAAELRADVDGLQGWLASLQHDYVKAAAAYELALEDCLTSYGDQHPLTAWIYILAGRSAFDAGSAQAGLVQMRTGLRILRDTVGSENAEYASGELAYSVALQKNGRQAEAGEIRADAMRVLTTRSHSSCANCTVSVWSLRNP